MTQGTPSPRGRVCAGAIDFARQQAMLAETLRQLGDLIRHQAAEYDRLTRTSLTFDTALYAWQNATILLSEALVHVEAAHAGLADLTPDFLRAIVDLDSATTKN